MEQFTYLLTCAASRALPRCRWQCAGQLQSGGDETIQEALFELQDRAAQLTRSNIADLPDGTFICDARLDNDRIVDEPLKITLDLTIAGDRIILEFSRSSAACAGPVNISQPTPVASIYVALKHVFTDVPDIPNVVVFK